MKVSYNQSLKQKARALRNRSSTAEIMLWKRLRAKQLLGYRFSRQRPIDDYIVDFYCNALHLVIEIDGPSHSAKKQKDKEKQQKLEKLGLTILRFSNRDVKCDLDGVITTLSEWIIKTEVDSGP